jgi:hypothetical protein
VSSLCLDLDAKTPKAVGDACDQADLPRPRGLHDPNHFIKAVKGRLIDIKKQIKMTNVLPPCTQLRLAQQVALAVHQHRAKGAATMKGAVLNVCKHAFNDHSDCLTYFNCPVARKKRTTSTYNKDGAWLDTAGSVAGGTKLKVVLAKMFVDITTDKHMAALAHEYNTQWCESINSLHVSMHPKRRDLSKGRLGRAIHKFTAARFNDGLHSAVSSVLQHLGINAGSVTEIICKKDDDRRLRNASFKASVHGKAKRKAAREKRKLRDAKASEREGEPAYQSNQGLSVQPEAGAAQSASTSQAVRRCGLCKLPGHDRRNCPKSQPSAEAMRPPPPQPQPPQEPSAAPSETAPPDAATRQQPGGSAPQVADDLCALCCESSDWEDPIPCAGCDCPVHHLCFTEQFPEESAGLPDDTVYCMNCVANL